MNKKEIKKELIEQLCIIRQCRKYNLTIWQCPQFVFLIMGVVIISSALLTYTVGFRYIDDPLMIALIVLLSSWVLFILAYFITHSVEKLAEASRMKMEFLTIMTHQIRTPFTNLRWVVDLLVTDKVGSFDKKQKEYLEILRENSERLEELINKIVTVSKIEQGEFPMKKKKFSLEKLVAKAVKESKVYAAASNIEVETDISKEIPELLADQEQITEVIENLLNNAIKYSKKKGKVKILATMKEKKVYVEIKDTGLGIPEEDQKYIFRKFFRSKNAIKHQTQGSGLGLFIIKSIIKAHKGKVGFSSQMGKGTTFWFTLPIKK